MAPAQVTRENKLQVFYNIYKSVNVREYLSKRVQPSLRVGDKIRRKYELGRLDKGYYPNWTDQIFTVTRAQSAAKRPMYKIRDGQGDELPQGFYPEEIQHVIEDKYRIEKIIKRQRLGGQRGYIVKWLNHPDSYNSWVPETAVVQDI